MLVSVGLLALLLGGCGASHSNPAPVTSTELLSDLFSSTAADSQYGYSSVLVTGGRGTRRFVRASWPRHIADELPRRTIGNAHARP